jgi:hypothetical protein
VRQHIRALVAARKGAPTPVVDYGRHETAAEGYQDIPLTKGYVARVDASLYDWLSSFSWTADVKRGGYVFAKAWMGGRKPTSMHRAIMNAPAGVQIDHRNDGSGMMADGFTIDNRRANLRFATATQNAVNADAPRTNTTGFKGVQLCGRTRRWLARIKTNEEGTRRTVHLGAFASKARAALAYDQAARQIHDPDFIRPNFPGIAHHDQAVQGRIDRFLHKTAWVHNKSGVRYITWEARSKRWIVAPRRNGKAIYVGSFTTLDGAKSALAHFTGDVGKVQRKGIPHPQTKQRELEQVS